MKYELEQQKPNPVAPPAAVESSSSSTPPIHGGSKAPDSPTKTTAIGPTVIPKAKAFRGSVEVNATLAKSRLNAIAEEVISLLASDPNATVRITVEIDVEFPHGASDTVKRGVSENAKSLGFKSQDWE